MNLLSSSPIFLTEFCLLEHVLSFLGCNLKFAYPQDSKVYFSKLRHGDNCPNKMKFSMDDIHFEQGILYAYMCTLCNFVQLKKENVEKHLFREHNRNYLGYDDIIRFEIINHKPPTFSSPPQLGPPELVKENQLQIVPASLQLPTSMQLPGALSSTDHNYSIAMKKPKKEKVEVVHQLQPTTSIPTNDNRTTVTMSPIKLSPEASKIVNKYSATINTRNLLKIWSSQTTSKQIPFITLMLQHSSLFHLYKCMNDFCSFSSSNEAQAYEHFKSHQAQTHECCYCDNMFNKSYEIVEHISNVHGGSNYACHMCFYRSISAYNCLVHQVKT